MGILRRLASLASQPESYYKVKMVMPLLEENKNASLLDLGCGNGDFTRAVARAIGASEVYGVDYAKESIDRARVNGVQVSRGDLNKEFPFPDERFDLVLANQVIEHIYDTDGFLRELRRVLKTGGYTIIATVNLASSLNLFYLVWGKHPPGANVSNEVVVGTPLMSLLSTSGRRIGEGQSHVRVFTLGALKELLQYHGFGIDRVAAAGYYPFPIPLARAASAIDRAHSAYITVKARKVSS